MAEVILDEIAQIELESLVRPLPRDVRLLGVAQTLIDHPADERSLRGGGAYAAISERILSHRFVEETGLDYSDWGRRPICRARWKCWRPVRR